MAISPTLRNYLDHNATYDVMTHAPTMSSMHTAEACHIPGARLAKAVVLRRNGGYMLAVLPASHHIRMAELRKAVGDDVDLAAESDIDRLFGDCAHGAVPPIGTCYGLDVIVDDSVEEQPDVYLEGGDHATVVHLDGPQFKRLMADSRHGRFSKHD
jgi:Ala-tRNA(Pro) deacylase